MTVTITRPGNYAHHAQNKTVDVPTVAVSTGYIAGSLANPDVADALGKQHGLWVQYCDVTGTKIEDFLDPNMPALVRGVALTYPTSAGLANLAPVTTPAAIGGGCRTTWDLTALAIYGLANAAFAPNARTWFYGTASTGPGQYPVVRVDVVAPLAPSTPTGTEIVIGGVDTNAADVTANLGATIGQTITFDSDLAFTGPMTTKAIDSLSVSCRSLDVSGGAGVLVTVTGDDVDTAATIDGVTKIALDVVSNNNNPAIPALNIANTDPAGTALVCGRANFTGDVVLGGVGSAVIVPAVPTFQDEVNFTDTVNFPGVTLVGGTVDVEHVLAEDIDLQANDGWISIGEARYLTDATPSTTLGVVQFDGRAHTTGDGTSAIRIAAPLDDYNATIGPSGITVTGATVTLTLDAGETIVIKVDSEGTNDGIIPEFWFRIRVNGVTQGGQASRWPALGGQYVNANRTVHYTAGGAGAVTCIVEYHPAGGVNVTAQNVQLSVRRI